MEHLWKTLHFSEVERCPQSELGMWQEPNTVTNLTLSFISFAMKNGFKTNKQKSFRPSLTSYLTCFHVPALLENLRKIIYIHGFAALTPG